MGGGAAVSNRSSPAGTPRKVGRPPGREGSGAQRPRSVSARGRGGGSVPATLPRRGASPLGFCFNASRKRGFFPPGNVATCLPAHFGEQGRSCPPTAQLSPFPCLGLISLRIVPAGLLFKNTFLTKHSSDPAARSLRLGAMRDGICSTSLSGV